MQSLLSTKETLQNTIQTDRHVFRWFLHVLIRHNPKDTALRHWQMIEYYLYVLCLVAFAGYFVRPGWDLAALIIFIIGGVWVVVRRMQNRVAQLSLLLVEKYVGNETFKQNSLYKNCEIIARACDTGSLVDALGWMDVYMRRMLVVSALVVLFVYPLDFFKGLCVLGGVYLVWRIILYSPAAYSRALKPCSTAKD